MTQLLSCPFCGDPRPRYMSGGPGNAYVKCACGIETVDGSRERVTAIWNQRKCEHDLTMRAEALQKAEADYRQAHDLYGPDDRRTGRAWDLMRRAGDNLRTALVSGCAG